MQATQAETCNSKLCTTGIEGFDEILKGGFPANCLYVIQGEPGSGKTTLALQFLLEGRKQKENCLYITFSETKRELETVASSHGWTLDGIDVIDLSMLEAQLSPDAHTTMFHSSEVELNQITELVLKRIEELQPSRVVFDSISEMRLLAETPLRYRRQVLALKQVLAKRDCTVLFLDDLTASSKDLHVQSIAHGVIGLSRLHHDFGGERRRVRILKLRGVNFVGGHHDYDIERGGLIVYPRLVSAQFNEGSSEGKLTSGIKALDSLLGGGLDYGTGNLIIGPAGSGKSTIGMKYVLSATQQNQKVAYFTFDETTSNFYKRSESIGISFKDAEKKGLFRIQKVDPAEISPGAFSGSILNLVQKENVKVVVIDSLNGYIQAMPQEQFLLLQLHELLAYLNNQGIVTIMMLAQQGMIGTMQSPVDLTYLADTVVLTRFFETNALVKKAISVIKKRTGYHENTIREFGINDTGLFVGEPLKGFHGILTGVPRLIESQLNSKVRL
jgi:circadian clock protein KaiC